MNFEYNMTFLNTESTWEKQFSWDEQGMYVMSVVFFFVQFLLTLAFSWILGVVAWCKLQKKVERSSVLL